MIVKKNLIIIKNILVTQTSKYVDKYRVCLLILILKVVSDRSFKRQKMGFLNHQSPFDNFFLFGIEALLQDLRSRNKEIHKQTNSPLFPAPRSSYKYSILKRENRSTMMDLVKIFLKILDTAHIILVFNAQC